MEQKNVLTGIEQKYKNQNKAQNRNWNRKINQDWNNYGYWPVAFPTPNYRYIKTRIIIDPKKLKLNKIKILTKE